MRFRGAYGGRGSAKTRTFAKMAAVRGLIEAESGNAGIVLCGREFMNSLDDSSMSEVKAAIADEPWLAANYEVGEKYIRTKDKRVAFKFAGLRHNLDSLKSKARILLAWVDEGESVSDAAWRKLIPTVREAGSEIWITWNPEKEGSPTDIRFRKTFDQDMIVVEMNYTDNPWFPAILDADRRRDQRNLDPLMYAHIWEGDYLAISDAQILRGKYVIEGFEPGAGWNGPYYGADWGFAQDPTTLVKLWIHGRKLYVEHEAYGIGVDIDATPALFDRVPSAREHVVRADSARPETISYMQRHGFPRCVGVEKWKGSVEDGIAHLRQYEQIVIHPRCRHFAEEAKLYSYKTDRLTGDVLPEVVDAHNHCIDAARYALQPLIVRGDTGLLEFYAGLANQNG